MKELWAFFIHRHLFLKNHNKFLIKVFILGDIQKYFNILYVIELINTW